MRYQILFCALVALSLFGCDSGPPTAENVLNRFVKVTGGADAYEKLKTRHDAYTQSYDGSDQKIRVVSEVQKGRGVFTQVAYPNGAQSLTGYCENTAWAYDDRGPRILDGDVGEWVRISSYLAPQIKTGDLYSKIDYVERTTFDGVECDVIEYTTTGGMEYQALYDVETGNIRGNRFTIDSDGETFKCTTTYNDHRKVEGFTTPFKIVTHMSNLTTGDETTRTTEVLNVVFDLELPDQYFELPEPIKNLSNLPEAEKLFARHIEAVGGEEKLRSIRSRRESARTTYYHDSDAWAETTEEIVEGQKVRWTGRYSDGTTSVSGYDGKTAYQLKNGKPVALNEVEKKQYAFFARISPFLDRASIYKTLKTTQRLDFKGVQCYEVEAVTHSGLRMRFYFATDTDLKRGIAISTPSDQGQLSIERLFSDYREVGGEKIAHEMTAWYKRMPQGQEWISKVKTTQLEVNVDFDSGHFAIPDAAKPVDE